MLQNKQAQPKSQALFDHLQHIYNQEGKQQRQVQKLQKNMYYQVVQANEAKKKERMALEQQLRNYENQNIRHFQEQENQKARQADMKRRMIIEETRKLNNSANDDIMRRAANLAPDPVEIRYAKEEMERMQQAKQDKLAFMDEAARLEEYRNQQRKQAKILDRSISVQKQHENKNYFQNREQDILRWKKKHFNEHNPQLRHSMQQLHDEKVRHQDMLQDYIARQGAIQMHQRAYRMKMDEINRTKNQKQEHIHKLQEQLQNNEARTAFDKQNEIYVERSWMEAKNRSIQERERQAKMRRDEENRQHLLTLRGQIRPRNLLQEKDKFEYAGIGSPVHIGKVVGDDRRRQLAVIEKSLYKELVQ